MSKKSVAFLIPSLNPPESLRKLVEDLRIGGAEIIVVVNDGSSEKFNSIFESIAAIPGVYVLKHFNNLGKGAALKNGFNFILNLNCGIEGVVTLDSDGQHLVGDALMLAAEFEKSSEDVFLGVRDFGKGTPWRSLFGNVLTAWIYRLYTGMNLKDTQTGLRAIPVKHLPEILKISKNGYDYEMEVLLALSSAGVALKTVLIQTVYLEKNKSSHFNPLLDSLKIYFTFLRFSLTSILCSALDMLCFYLAFQVTHNSLISMGAGRVFAATLNFFMNRRFVFKSNQKKWTQIISFVGLVFLLGAISYFLMSSFIIFLDFNVYWAKICAEVLSFALSFSFQEAVVFRRRREH
jgi:glycosyltransferase involved in cell wall biosynthesis